MENWYFTLLISRKNLENIAFSSKSVVHSSASYAFHEKSKLLSRKFFLIIFFYRAQCAQKAARNVACRRASSKHLSFALFFLFEGMTTPWSSNADMAEYARSSPLCSRGTYMPNWTSAERKEAQWPTHTRHYGSDH